MPIDDFLTAAQPPPLSGIDLGVPDLPVGPQMPQAPASRMGGILDVIRQAIPGVVGGLMGPGAGTGLLQGYVTGTQQREATERQQHQDAIREYQLQQQAYAQQQQQHDIALRRREDTLQRNVESLRTAAAKAPDKKAYDALVEAYASGLRMLGFTERVDANYLRRAVPYAAPDAPEKALEVFQRWLKLPNNVEALKTNPQLAMASKIPMDLYGTGEKATPTLGEIMTLAGVVGLDQQSGEPLIAPVESNANAFKANADGILQQLVAQKKAERVPITPELMVKLQQEAIKIADQAKPEDPYLTEMRRMRTEEMRRRQNIPQDLSPAQFNMANKLADDFTRDSKDFVARAQSYQTVLAAAKDPSAAGDLSLIFAYMKMLDPGSVVREGEFATAQNTASVPDRIRNAYNRVISGERLNPNQRADFVRQAANVYGASKARQDQIITTYRSRAARAQVPPELVVMDYGIAEPTPTEPPAANDAAATAQQKLRNRP